MKTITIRRVGNGLSVILPAEMFAELGLSEGDEIVAKAGEGVIALSAAEPSFQRQMELAEEIMDEYAETLAELAK
jgi:putative addiction module antidote